MSKQSDTFIVTLDDQGNENIVDPNILSNYSLKADVDPGTGSKNVPDKAFRYGKQVVEPKYNPRELVDLLDFNSYHADCVDAVAGDAAGISFTLLPVEGETESEAERKRFMDFLNECEPSINTMNYRMLYDRRSIGYGALELTRWGKSDSLPRRLVHIQAHTLRRHVDGKRVQQLNDQGKDVWFVIYGKNYDEDGNWCDVDADTGEWCPYNSLSAEKRANELLWTYEYAPKTSYYGRPPIIGSLLSIQGVLSAKRYNNAFFENYGMPAFAVTITGDFADYTEEPYIEDGEGNKIENPNYDYTQTIRYKISQQIKQVIKNPHSAICITVPTEGEDGKVEVKIQPLSVQQEEGSFRLFLKDERDEIIHAHKVDPSRIGIYDAGKLNGTNSQFTDNSYKYSTVAPIKKEAEDLINLIAKNELDVHSWEYRASDLDPKDYRNDMALAEFLFARAAMTPRDLINNFGDQFGLSIPEDNPYLDEYYLNNVPLESLWNNVENNSNLEGMTILQTLEDNLWSEDSHGDTTEEPEEIDSPAED